MTVGVTMISLLLAITWITVAAQTSSTGTNIPSSCGTGVTELTCPTDYTCENRVCVYRPCLPSCTTGQQCSYGSCVNSEYAVACSPVCKYPEVCSLTGLDNQGTCLSDLQLCSQCQVDELCVYGTCQRCKTCGNDTLTAVALTSAWGSNVYVTRTTTSTGLVGDGELATLTSASSVTLGVANGTIGQAGIHILTGTTGTVTGAITTRALKGGIIVQAGASLTAGSVQVPGNLTTTIAFESLGSQLATPNNAWVTLNGLSVTGDLVITGTGRVNLPSSITVGAGGMLTVAGNATLYGNLGALPVYVGYINSQSGDVRLNLSMSGTILGATSDMVYVEGSLTYSGAIIQPTLVVADGSIATISSSSVKIGDVSLIRSGQLVINNPGLAISFTQFAECDATSLIVIKVSSISSLREGTYTAARFETVSQTAGDVMCWIKLVDSTGAFVLLPHVYTEFVDPEDGGGRRLLAMNAASRQPSFDAINAHGQWTPNGYVVPTNGNSTFDYNTKLIQYTYSKSVTYTYVSGASSVVPALTTLVAMLVTMVCGRL